MNSLVQLAQSQMAAGWVGEAESTLLRALAGGGGDPAVHEALGILYFQTGRMEQAVGAFARCVAADPLSSGAHYNHARVLQAAGRSLEAIEAYRRAIALKADNAEAYNNLGNTLLGLHRVVEAVEALRKAVALRADYALAWNNLGVALKDQGRHEEAAEAYRKAIGCRPDYREAHSNLLMELHYTEAAPEALLGEHRAWAARFAPEGGAVRHGNVKDAARKLKVGYVSADFRSHSMAFFIEPILANHDRARVEVTCYSSVARPDEMTRRLARYPARWRDVRGMDDGALAAQIRADGIDVLVDLSAHSGGNRLMTFARRPAPVQVSYLGYPSTTGMPQMDWVVMDPHLCPEGDEGAYAERVLRLPRTYFCYRPPEIAPAVAARGGGGAIVFASFNILAKVTPQVVALWAGVLQSVGDATLVMKARGLDDPATQAYVHGLFAERGIDSARVIVQGYSEFPRFLDECAGVDIALDTFPYNGGTITLHGLWMGVPAVTLAGRTGVSRMGASILANMGLGELVAHDEEGFVRIASELARDRARLAELRATLRGRMGASAVCDAKGFVTDLEEAYRRAWGEWCGR